MTSRITRVGRGVAAAGVLLGGALLVSYGTDRRGTATPVADFATPVVSAAARAMQSTAQNPQRNAYFGDTHVHTSWSLDAYMLGGNRDDPTVAYRYGRGEKIVRPDGSVIPPLEVPLDFMAVTDHDAWLGEVQACEDAKDPAYNTPTCKDVRAMAGFGGIYGKFGRNNVRPPDICGTTELNSSNRCFERTKHLWAEIQKNANTFNQPGKFTTFPGYEFTAQPVGIGHLHRVVLFRGEKLPEWGGSAVEMKNSPEKLWEWLDAACTGECQVMAIPHNTNWSQGVSMAARNSDGTPFTREILARRIKAEPLVEIFQIKGNSECYAGLGTTDEECNLELYYPICKPGQTSNCAYAADFVRNAMKTGLTVEAQYGINPFKYGVIASTDDHKSTGGDTDEKGFNYKFGVTGSIGGPWGEDKEGGNITNPGGLAGVWATENTRPALFDAMKRRETFGTSGTRIRVRLFGGWQYPENLHTRQTLLQDAYASGVPMGADLPSRPGDAKAPRFVAWATKDPRSVNLQKIQIVKGWAKGDQTFERVFDVACADGLRPDPKTHRCVDNGATVNLANCSVSSGKGAAELSTTWTDPEFDPADRAFYYVRVLENPTCRWTVRRALDKGTPVPKPSALQPATIKEQAWSSPIWYTPANR